MKVELETQVLEFVRRLPPDPKKLLRQALRDLERQSGDIEPLEPPLEGFYRLAVAGYRVILSYPKAGVVRCEFAERRPMVYTLFEEEVLRRLGR